MLSTIIILLSMASLATSGHVGECRSECVEQNKYLIVRVHLKENLVMAGVCRNTTLTKGNLATVIPFVCNKHIGVWTFDEADEEGIASFPVRCPPNHPVPAEQINACPKPF